jgi:hydrogenase small subunit
MDRSGGGLAELMAVHGVSRRAFLQFSAAMAGVLALPPAFAPRIAAALETTPRVPLIWLEGQDCAGDTEGFLRASHPTTAELVLGILSLDYHETIMVPSGPAAEQSRADTMDRFPDGYICVVEGSIPVAGDGIYCTVGGRTFKEIARETIDGALATIAVGTCAFDGGLSAAAGGPTGAIGVEDLVPGATLINMPGCPLNVQNLTATIVHYLTFKEWPATDSLHRPLFAYGQLVHDQCERRAHFEQGEYVVAWGDDGARKGWCLYKMGFNDRTSWSVKAGHGCVGCTMPAFWDQMTPFYRRLPAPPPFASEVTADQVGLVLVGGVAALSVAHGGASYVRQRRRATAAEAEAAGGGVAVLEPPAAVEAAAPPHVAGAVPPSTPVSPSGQDEGTDR